MEKLFVMSKKDLERYAVLEKAIEKRISQVNAAEMLGISDRHFRRLMKAYKKEGARGLASKRIGKPSNNRKPEKERKEATKLIKKKYEGFGPTLAREKLLENHRIKASVETVRKWMIEEGLWKEKRKREGKVHQSRERREREGELVQIDGSPHDWFEGRREKCCLLGFIDDATSKIKHLKFIEVETTRGYLEGVKEYIEKHGRPERFYSDRHNIFRINSKEDGYRKKGITQLGRALKELSIELICANSPQAKGRIERLFKTLQDRLVKELRLEGISTTEEANKYLEKYIKKHNRKFAIEALKKENKHRELEKETDLEEILCYKTERTVSKNLEISYEGRVVQIEPDKNINRLKKTKIMVVEKLDGTLKLDHQGKELKYKDLLMRDHQGRILDRKRVLGTTQMTQKRVVA